MTIDLKEGLIIGILLLVYSWLTGHLMEDAIQAQVDAIITAVEADHLLDMLLATGILFVISYHGLFLAGFLTGWLSNVCFGTFALGLVIHTFIYYLVATVLLYVITEDQGFEQADFLSAFVTGVIAGLLVGGLGYYFGQRLTEGEEEFY